MSVRIDLPFTLEAKLRGRMNDLERTAKEALLLNLYRRGETTHFELAIALGLTRQELDELLSAESSPADESRQLRPLEDGVLRAP